MSFTNRIDRCSIKRVFISLSIILNDRRNRMQSGCESKIISTIAGAYLRRHVNGQQLPFDRKNVLGDIVSSPVNCQPSPQSSRGTPSSIAATFAFEQRRKDIGRTRQDIVRTCHAGHCPQDQYLSLIFFLSTLITKPAGLRHRAQILSLTQ